MIGVVPMVLVVPPSSPATTIAELIALARSKPGELNYGSAGNGSDNHLTAELFNHLAGIKVAHVPYRGGGQVMTDLIAGRVSFVFATMPTALPFIGEGRLRALATTGQGRSPALPQVPTVAESALPDFVLYAWLGLFGPAGIPPPILDQAQHRDQRGAAASRRRRSGCARSASRSRAARRRSWPRISSASSTAGRSSPAMSASRWRIDCHILCVRPARAATTHPFALRRQPNHRLRRHRTMNRRTLLARAALRSVCGHRACRRPVGLAGPGAAHRRAVRAGLLHGRLGAAARQRADRAARPVGDRREPRRRRRHRRHDRGRARARRTAIRCCSPTPRSRSRPASIRTCPTIRCATWRRSAGSRTRPRSCWCGPGLGPRTLAELVALAKQKPGEITFGSGGPGSSAHLAMELLLNVAGIQALHVPFRGVAAAIAEVIAGRVDMAIASLASGVAHVQGRHAHRPRRVRRASAAPCCRRCRPSSRRASRATTCRTGGASRRRPARRGRSSSGCTARSCAPARSRGCGRRSCKQAAVAVTSTPEEMTRHLEREIGVWREVITRAKVTHAVTPTRRGR